MTLWADLDRDRRVGGSRPNQNDYVFFCKKSKAWAEPDPKTAYFAFLGYPSTILRTAYTKNSFTPNQ